MWLWKMWLWMRIWKRTQKMMMWVRMWQTMVKTMEKTHKMPKKKMMMMMRHRKQSPEMIHRWTRGLPRCPKDDRLRRCIRPHFQLAHSSVGYLVFVSSAAVRQSAANAPFVCDPSEAGRHVAPRRRSLCRRPDAVHDGSKTHYGSAWTYPVQPRYRSELYLKLRVIDRERIPKRCPAEAQRFWSTESRDRSARCFRGDPSPRPEQGTEWTMSAC
mmetsp:Transcript_7315/g.22463  ORF Transcript_7315/g.22463 Transcript_7315/m.22463 type:complete len:214 (-) Transcript_7315:220-861(-)